MDSIGIQNNIYTLQFFTRFIVLFAKTTLESRENMTVNAAILCPILCTCDVINKAGMCGKCIRYVTSQPLSALAALVKSKPTRLRP